MNGEEEEQGGWRGCERRRIWEVKKVDLEEVRVAEDPVDDIVMLAT